MTNVNTLGVVALSETEMAEIDGGVLPFIAGAVIGATVVIGGAYAIYAALT